MSQSWQILIKRNLIYFICTVLVVLLLGILPGWGNQFQAGQTITINSDLVTNDDIYLAGETITIDGTVKGDAVLAARQITINGTVEGDLIAAGQEIVINGKVGDDLRLAAQVLQIGENAQVIDDAIAAAFSLETQANSNIGGNLYFFGAQALVNGKIAQNFKATMGALELGGKVERNVGVIVVQDIIKPPAFGGESSLPIPDLPPGLTVTDSASIGGKLSYLSPRKATIAEEAQITGPIEYTRIEVVTQPTVTEIAIAQLRRLIALILIAWLWFKFVPSGMPTLANIIQNRPWPSLGWGIVTVLAVGISAIATLIGTLLFMFILALTLSNLIFPVLSLGLLTYFTLLIGFFLFTSYVSPIAVGFLGGSWLVQKITPHQTPQPWISSIIGLVVLVILTAIPLFGILLNILVALLGLGAFWLWGKKFRD